MDENEDLREVITNVLLRSIYAATMETEDVVGLRDELMATLSQTFKITREVATD